MSLALILSFFQFCVTMSITPGPNTMMLAVSGVNFGFKRTLGHMLGITIGFPIMFIAAGFGLGEVFTLFPTLYDILKIVGFIYLLYLAWKIANFSGSMFNDNEDLSTLRTGSKPFSFWQAAGFQWLNPKAWVFVLVSSTNYTSMESQWPLLSQIMLLSFIVFLVSIPAVTIWAYFGSALAPLLKNNTIRRVFNVTMAVLIVVSVLIASFAA